MACAQHQDPGQLRPPATEDEIPPGPAIQFVRNLSGTTRPARANEAAFERAVDEVTDAANRLIRSLTTVAPPQIAKVEAVKGPARARERYARA